MEEDGSVECVLPSLRTSPSCVIVAVVIVLSNRSVAPYSSAQMLRSVQYLLPSVECTSKDNGK